MEDLYLNHQPACNTCGYTENLLRCSRCQVVHYCSPAHQRQDHASHKHICKTIASARANLDNEDRTLRNHTSNDMFFLPAKPFESSAGHFWGIMGTRDYMRARFGYIDALRVVDTYSSVSMQLEHMMDMLRLCRSDNMGIRDRVPATMLRLHKDQECYDFIKWYETTGQESDYDRGNLSLGFLDLKGADVFEDVDFMLRKFPSLNKLIAMTLFKIRLLLDIQGLQQCNILLRVSPRLPPEIIDKIKSYIPNSPCVVANRQFIEGDVQTLSNTINTLKLQIDKLYNKVEQHNEHFWEALVDPGEHLTARPEYYSAGTVMEMQLALQNAYKAWDETPGAIEYVIDRSWV